VQEAKTAHLRGVEPLSKVAFDSKLHVVQNALGTHTTISRVQGSKLKSKHEIRIASLFKDAPPEFLRMIVVHELAHLRQRAHDKAFYQLCAHMEPQYHQWEFEVRVYLTHLEATGERLWAKP
jgi:predicted metal-dependent hydrolase